MTNTPSAGAYEQSIDGCSFDVLGGTLTFCVKICVDRSRGGDGFAFVIQDTDPVALGGEGQEMGYGGIANSIAVEFDTWYNHDTLDPGENHVSVHTRGSREGTSANQSYSLGHSSLCVASPFLFLSIEKTRAHLNCLCK